MMTAATGRPLPSTRAFVASVVLRLTNSMPAGDTTPSDNTASMAPHTPMARSWCVVGDLAAATTVRVASS